MKNVRRNNNDTHESILEPGLLCLDNIIIYILANIKTKLAKN